MARSTENSFECASIGLSADLAKEITSETKKRWGKLGYGIAAIRLLARMRPFTAEITHDGVTERVKTVQIAVGNGRHYGGGMIVEASAVWMTGCCILQPGNRSLVEAAGAVPGLSAGHARQMARCPGLRMY